MNTKYVVLGVAILLVLGAGIHYYSTKNEVAAPVQTTESPTQTPAPAKTFDLVVKNRKLISGEPTLTVKQGDTVAITITADESDELHLHGYDKSVEFEANNPATLTFTASQSGRFPFEMEGSKTDLGEVVVEP